jgi:transposase-like protein
MANMRKWRRHTVEFKRQVVERMKTAANINDLARELDLERKLLYTWKYQLEGRPEPRHANLGTTAEERKEKKLQDEIAKLKSALADKALETDFFKSALLKVNQGRQERTGNGGTASTTTSIRGRKSKAN